MMVLCEEDADVCIGPNINSEASPQTISHGTSTMTRRFEAKLHCSPAREASVHRSS